MARASLTCTLALVGLVASAPAAAAQASLPAPLELRVPKAPTVAHGADGAFLVYELHVSNFGAQALTLKTLEVTSADPARRVLFTLSDSTLAQSISRPGPAVPAAERARVAGGMRAIVFVWMPVDTTAIPASVRNRVRLEQGTGDSVRVSELEGPAVAVTRTGPTIGPPLRGGPWLVGNGPNARTGHRRALVPTGGAPTIAQRFAIDYVKLNDANTTYHDDRLANANYYAEGNDALAVADGRVVAVKDSIPENVPGAQSRAVPITLETVGGNHVILDIGGGYYAFYAHLKPGSLRVKLGDQVKRGQVLGLVGNSGNSTEPHLHFHVSDGTSPLGSEGVPYRIDSFQQTGRCTTFGSGCVRDGRGTRRGEVPLGNAIVQFP
jgi:murein DD-endopeptidase